jgi:hypothetical protein
MDNPARYDIPWIGPGVKSAISKRRSAPGRPGCRRMVKKQSKGCTHDGDIRGMEKCSPSELIHIHEDGVHQVGTVGQPAQGNQRWPREDGIDKP